MTDVAYSTVAGTVDIFKATPALLLIVLINGFFVAAAGWYLLKVEEYRELDRKALIGVLDSCINHTVPVDYLLGVKAQPKPKED